MCKNKDEQYAAKQTVYKKASEFGRVARILAIYENLGERDLIGFFAEYVGKDEANLFEVKKGGEVRVANFIPNYTGMGRKRIAHMFSPMGYAIPC